MGETPLVERLRADTIDIPTGQPFYMQRVVRGLSLEAADEIDRLTAELERMRQASEWQPIETAPKDGTKIDLLYPYPRCRMIDAFWVGDLGFGWVTRVPTWNDCGLAPENEWSLSSYPNIEPMFWRPLPEPPTDIARQSLSNGDAK